MARLSGLRLALICVMSCCCGLSTRVHAQEIGPLQVKDDLHADKTYTDVYVNDSFEAVDAIAKAQGLAERGQWGEAAKLLQRTADTTGHKLIRVSPGSYVGIREHINKMIAGWPQAGLAAYRTLFESRCTSGLHGSLLDAGASRRVHELLPRFDRYFCTASAAKLAHTIGLLAIESGDLILAEHVYRYVLEHHPDRGLYASNYRAMLALLAVMGGEVDVPSFEADALIRWKGQDRPLREVVNEVRNTFSTLGAQTTPLDWPMFGGEPERNRRSSTRVDELGLLWRFDAFQPQDLKSDEHPVDLSDGGDRERAKHLTIQPVASDGLVFVQCFREIVALHGNTGAVAWRFAKDATGSGAMSYLEDSPVGGPGWDAVTVHQGRVYASLPGEAVSYYSYESTRSPAELVCLDANTGRLIWRLDQQIVEEEFAEVTFDSSPLVRQGRLFAVGRRRRSFGFEDCYLYCFNATTGALQYRTHLGSASTGTFGLRQATFSVAAMHGDTLYVCTNLGTIAAVAGHTGAVRWLRLYERSHGNQATGSGRSGQDARPWQYNPVIWSAGRIIVLPSDAAVCLVLAADDGSLVQSVPVEKVGSLETILGVRGDVLCGVGREVACYDLSTEAKVWSTPLPDGATPYGRGVWTDDRLLIPTDRGLSTFLVSNGQQSLADWALESEGGNLLALPNQLVVAGASSLWAYVRRTEILGALRERMTAAPSDPLPALELAEVVLGNGEFSEAVVVLDEAVRRAEGLQEPLEPSLTRRFFDDTLMFVQRLSAHSMLDTNVLDKLLHYASQYPPDTEAHLTYRFRFADLLETYGQPERAMRLYHQILRDRFLRDLPAEPRALARAESAGAKAQTLIAAMIAQQGRSIYAPYEAEAHEWLERARTVGDEATLQRIVETFPNSETAPLALIAHGELFARRGLPEEAAKRFAKAYHRYPKQVDRPTLLRKIADAYETAGKPQHAYRWLTKATREHPSVRIDHAGQLVTFREYRKRLDHVRGQVEPSHPNVALPLNEQFVRDFKGTVSLLVPRFGAAPSSSWSRYFVHTPAGIRAFDARTDTELWPKPAPVRPDSEPARADKVELLIATSEVAVFATPHTVFALDVATGARRWFHGEHAGPGAPGDDHNADWEDADGFRAHALQGNRLVSVRDSGRMSCIAIDTGKLIWSQTHQLVPSGRLQLTDPWVVYHVTQDDRPMVCLINAETGDWFDAIITDEKLSIKEIFVTLDGQIIVAMSQSLLSYEPETHKQRWRVTLRGHLRRASLLLDVDALYFSEDGRRLKKISLEDGHLLWESEPLLRRDDDNLTVGLKGNSVIVSSTTSVSAVDAANGLTLWRGTTPDRPRFVSRLLTRSYVLAVDVPGEPSEPRPLGSGLPSESVAYFYDHRNASGLIPTGGAVRLGPLSGLRAILAVDGGVAVQTGSTIRGWTHK